MKNFNNILQVFEVEKEMYNNYVLINISSLGSERISEDKHIENGIIQNIYFNDEIKSLERCYIFSSMLNALAYFSMYPIVLNEKILLIITGKLPTDLFVDNLKIITKTINKFYFCINNTLENKLLNTKLFVIIGLGDNVEIKELQPDKWILTYDYKEICFSKNIFSGISKLKNKLETVSLRRRLHFEFIAPQRQFQEFKNLYNY